MNNLHYISTAVDELADFFVRYCTVAGAPV